MPRARSLDGRPLVERARRDAEHALVLVLDPAPRPHVAVEIEIDAAERVQVVHWIAGERWRYLSTMGRA